MAAAGFDAKAVDTVVISHFHTDHVNGLLTADGTPAFPNAEILVPATEWKFWMDDGEMSRAPAGRMQSLFKNNRNIFEAGLKKKVTPYEWGKEVVPGMLAVESVGHTPGHTSYVLSSGVGQGIHPVGCHQQSETRSRPIRAGMRSSTRTPMWRKKPAAGSTTCGGRREAAGAGFSLPVPRPRPRREGRQRLPGGVGAVESDDLTTTTVIPGRRVATNLRCAIAHREIQSLLHRDAGFSSSTSPGMTVFFLDEKPGAGPYHRVL